MPNKNNKKGCIFFCLALLGGICLSLAIIGIIFLSNPSGLFGPKVEISTENPRPRYWSGIKNQNHANFIILSNRDIQNMTIQPRSNVGVPSGCKATWEKTFPLLNNHISSVISSTEKIIQMPAHNEFEGFYGTDNKFHGTFKIQISGQWEVSTIEGDWEAEWVSETKP